MVGVEGVEDDAGAEGAGRVYGAAGVVDAWRGDCQFEVMGEQAGAWGVVLGI